MKTEEYRKLDIDLPKQPIVNPRPWLVAGLLFALFIIAMVVCTYFFRR